MFLGDALIVKNVFEKKILNKLKSQIYNSGNDNEEAKENLLVNMLDNAEPAVKKAKPQRTLIVVLSLLGGFMIAVPISLILDRKEQ